MSTSALTHLFQEELYRFDTPVLVVLPREWPTYTPEEQLLLKKILTSVKVEINTVQMVVRPSVDVRSLQVYKPARVLIFGSAADDVIDMYQQIPAQGFMVIRTDDLNLLDDQKKKNLWVALRQMFGV